MFLLLQFPFSSSFCSSSSDFSFPFPPPPHALFSVSLTLFIFFFPRPAAASPVVAARERSGVESSLDSGNSSHSISALTGLMDGRGCVSDGDGDDGLSSRRLFYSPHLKSFVHLVPLSLSLSLPLSLSIAVTTIAASSVNGTSLSSFYLFRLDSFVGLDVLCLLIMFYSVCSFGLCLFFTILTVFFTD